MIFVSDRQPRVNKRSGWLRPLLTFSVEIVFSRSQVMDFSKLATILLELLKYYNAVPTIC